MTIGLPDLSHPVTRALPFNEEAEAALAVVPVGLTDHRFGLAELKNVDAPYASALLDVVGRWQKKFRKKKTGSFRISCSILSWV